MCTKELLSKLNKQLKNDFAFWNGNESSHILKAALINYSLLFFLTANAYNWHHYLTSYWLMHDSLFLDDKIWQITLTFDNINSLNLLSAKK